MTKTYYVFLGIACLACLGLGGFLTKMFLCNCQQEKTFSLKDMGKQEKERKENPQEQECELFVDVSGAVMKPGVVCLHEGAIVNDAVMKAEGFNPSAYAFKYVAQRINMARILENEEKIYIPFRDDVLCRLIEDDQVKYIEKVMKDLEEGSKGAIVEGQTTNTEQKSTTEGQNVSENTGDCISINDSSKEKLMELSGVGETRATDIIEGRPYSVLEDLKNVKGIGDKTFESLKEFICL